MDESPELFDIDLGDRQRPHETEPVVEPVANTHRTLTERLATAAADRNETSHA